MTIPDALRARALAYLADDPDPASRSELERLLHTGDRATLERAFGVPIAFGTAGLRAEVGPGPSRMNLRNVARATRALLEVVELEVPAAHSRGVVVGHDARPSSATFASCVSELAAARGFTVRVLEAPSPTPIAAFAGHHFEAAATIVITASHNPAEDNGMKVYGPRASQIVPPWDSRVAARMHDDRPTPIAAPTPEDRARIRPIGPELAAEHRRRSIAIGATTAARSPVVLAYTALHGVGSAFTRAALGELGAVDCVPVAAQDAPDGAFPTTPKPNPEHPAALVEVLALARSLGATGFLANDPDADRLAVGVLHDDAMVVLHGDELGVLLGSELVRRTEVAAPLLLTTIVSSPWLVEVGRALGARVEVTLTGHKWIHERASELEAEGATFVFGYEEAIGFAFANGVRDKDGIAAATFVARLFGESAAEGRTLVDRLEAIARAHGMHRSGAIAIDLPDDAARHASLARLAALLASPPRVLAGRAVEAVIDGRNAVRIARDGRRDPLGLPGSSLVGFELEGSLRVLVRPSGTEPKLKIYLDLRTELAAGESYLDARARADRALAELEPGLREALVGEP